MSEEKEEKIKHVINEVTGNNLTPGEAISLMDEVLGEPSFKKLTEQMLCACGHSKPVSEFGIVNTGLTDAVYNVCKGCEKQVGELSHLCCLGCKSTVGHMYPHKAPTGFNFSKGKYYHIKECGFCAKDKKKGKADVLEHVVFCKKNNIPTKSDPDYD